MRKVAAKNGHGSCLHEPQFENNKITWSVETPTIR